MIVVNLSEEYYFGHFVEPSRRLGVRFCVFDPSMFPKELSFSIHMNERGVVKGWVDVWEYLSMDHREKVKLSFNDINLAWYLRVLNTEHPQGEQNLPERFTLNESVMAVRSLQSILSCPWVNRRQEIRFVESNKLYQQLIASSVGLLVPSTVMGNSHEEVLTLMGENEHLLAKTIGYVKLDDKDCHFIYSEVFARSELEQAHASVASCPLFFQQYIPKLWEYRVMVIGGKVLACRIDSQASPQTLHDWRHYDFPNVEHKAVELPVEIQDKLRSFMQRVGLQYGAIDLIETPNHEFYFLEVNPSGQWGWIADFAGLRIPDAVAIMLAG